MNWVTSQSCQANASVIWIPLAPPPITPQRRPLYGTV